MPDTSDGTEDVRILLATVEAVDTVAYTVTAKADASGEVLDDIPFASLYANANHAGGVYAMPEVGARVYVAIASDRTRFVFAFVVDPSPADAVRSTAEGDFIDDAPPNFRGARPFIDPGDVVLATKGRNRITLKRGGIIEIAGNALCSTRYLPLSGLVAHFFRQYRMVSPLGEVEWRHSVLSSPVDPFEEDAPEVYAVLSGNYKADTVKPFAVEVRVGQVAEPAIDGDREADHLFGTTLERQDSPVGGTGRVSVLVRDDDQQAVFSFHVDDLGNLAVLGSTMIVEASEVVLDVATSAKLQFGAGVVEALAAENRLRAVVNQMVLTALGSMSLTAGSLTLSGSGNVMRLGGDTVAVRPRMRVGGGSAPVIVDRGLLANLMNHIHPIANGAAAPSPQLMNAVNLGRSSNLTSD